MEDLVSMCERRCRKACNLRSTAEDSEEACHSGSSGGRARRFIFFQGLPFKWSSGKFNNAPFAFHDDLRPRYCHACPDAHPMDVNFFVSHCPTCEHLVQTYVQCWRFPFTTVESQWWSATLHVGERRNVVRALVPMSLHTKLTTPPLRPKQAGALS